ncbi:MAG: SDR family oxidoreductase [Myxococcota bacterium]
MSLEGRVAVVVGGTSGVGKAAARALAAAGAAVTVVARGEDRVRAVASELGVVGMVGDATDERFVQQLVNDLAPDVLVLALGAPVPMGPIDVFTWEAFTSVWNNDTKASFLFGREALRRPLRPGSAVVVLSSGAGIGGSPLSGGYAGAKRMQWFLVNYLRGQSDARDLGIRFHALLPRQLIVGTEIGETAATTYGGPAGRDAYLARWPRPLTAEDVADALIASLDPSRVGQAAFAVDGGGALAPL